MKYLIRIILTIPALLVFGLAGVARLWQRGVAFTLNEKEPCPHSWLNLSNTIQHCEFCGARRNNPRTAHQAMRLLRDLADLQNDAPLERYREEWEETMQEVWEFLEENETE